MKNEQTFTVTIPCHYQPWLIVSDKSRPAISEPYLSWVRGRSELISTDGKAIVIIPVDADAGSDGVIPGDLLKRARDANPVEAYCESYAISLTPSLATFGGVSFKRDEVKHPDWVKSISARGSNEIRATLDAERLVEIQRALGACGLVLFIVGENDPIRIKSAELDDAAEAYLMPMRISSGIK